MTNDREIFEQIKLFLPKYLTPEQTEELYSELKQFPNDEAVSKLLYLALRNIAKKWTMPVHAWKDALNRFAIIYENRLPAS